MLIDEPTEARRPTDDPGAAGMIGMVRRIVTDHLPSHDTRDIVPLGAGEDHSVFRVGEGLLVRVAKDGGGAARGARVERERRLLRAVAGICPVPTPVPLFADADAGVIAYTRLPGVPMLSLPGAIRRGAARTVGAQLGTVLAALHAAPRETLEEIAGTDHRAPEEWLEEAAGLLERVDGALPVGARRAARRFLEEGGPATALEGMVPRFTHNDLGIEHVLVTSDGARVLGIIDWSDAAVTDPAVDFARILRDLGPPALDAALEAYGDAAREDAARRRPTLDEAPTPGRDPAFGERLWFYARCLALEDLAFGVETDAPTYVAKSLEAAHWLFPA